MGDSFTAKLAAYKKLIDDDVAVYANGARAVVEKNYGTVAQTETDAFLGILNRGGKRIRGALTMIGYEMSGGTNQAMIVQAARAIEMVHAFFLVIDDIQDRSPLRRGGPSAHAQLAQYHAAHALRGDGEHFGVSLALNAAISGASAAHIVLAGLDVDPQLRLNALSIVDRTLGVTAHGQTYDIYNEAAQEVSVDDIENVMLWKTAEYTVLNPLCVGMVLAGADCHATDAIRDYALNAGVAFQIIDDIISTFGDESKTGKSPMDDIREGKRTLMMVYVLDHAEPADKNFLRGMLGNGSMTEAEFARCKEILVASGAKEFAHAEARRRAMVATQALDAQAARWPEEQVAFLHGLISYFLKQI